MPSSLIKIEKTQTSNLTYLVNQDSILESTNRDLVLDNSLKTALNEKSNNILKNLKKLLIFGGKAR